MRRPLFPRNGRQVDKAVAALDHAELGSMSALSTHRASTLNETLHRDHQGISRFYYLDVPFTETMRRHARPQAAEFGEAEMRGW